MTNYQIHVRARRAALRVASRSAGLGALLLLIGSVGLRAQVNFGTKVGVSTSAIEGVDSDKDYEPRVGITAGLFVEVPVLPWFLFQPEIYYTQKGASTIDYSFVGNPPGPVGVPRSWHYEYVELAALFHFKTRGEPASGRFGFLVGPVVSQQISGVRDVPRGCFPEDFQSTVQGVALGASLEIDRAILEFRFQGLGQSLSPGCRYSQRHLYGAVLLGFRIF